MSDPQAELSGHTRRVSSVCFSPDGRRCLSGSLDRTVRLWDVASGQMIRSFDGHTTDVNGVAFSGDGRTVASCSGAVVGGENLIRLWSTETGAVVRMPVSRETHPDRGHPPVTVRMFA